MLDLLAPNDIDKGIDELEIIAIGDLRKMYAVRCLKHQ